jgi:hypothetical protein
MSCVGGQGMSDEEKQELQLNKKIEKELDKLEQKDKSELKILLLGAGASGKSTIFKQMKILNMSGYTEKEKLDYQPLIQRNVYEIFSSMIEFCQEQVEEHQDEKYSIPDDLMPTAQKILSTMEETQTPTLAPDMVEPLLALYSCDAMKLAYSRKNEFNLYDSAD